MARTALVYALPALLIGLAWLRLEEPRRSAETFGVVLLALAPALVRPWWARALAAAAVMLVAVRLAFGLSVLEARPRDGERDFFGPLASSFWAGALEYFEEAQPFSPVESPAMHSVLLLAVFGFCLALGLAVAARRPLLASVVVVAGAAWPATLVSGADLRLGAFLLLAVLVLLAAGGDRAPRVYRPAVLAGVALVVAAVAAGAQPAVAKSEFLRWQTWDFYDAPAKPVGVRYVWEANYGGIEFPQEETTVLTVEGPRRGLYWRATTLDLYENDAWTTDPGVLFRSRRTVDLSADTFLPPRGREPDNWIKAMVKVEALRDDHLVSPGMPVRLDPGDLRVVEYRTGGVAVVPGGLRQDQEYTVWAYAPQPQPEQLAAARPTPTRFRKTAEERYLEVAPGVAAPPFNAAGREAELQRLFAGETAFRRSALFPVSLAPYRELYDETRRVVGTPASPYAAAIALETWFRSGGGFVYDEQPTVAPPDRPPLLHFVLDDRRGYCQHYAGAMALMLRYLGIPARVAAGFTSGDYDRDRNRWTITNHDAHAWVEVWFAGWGWIPFDPTPARGELPGSYSSTSPTFPSAAVQSWLRGASGGAAGVFNRGRADGRLSADGSTFRGADAPGDLAGGTTASQVTRRGESLLRLLLLLALAGAAVVAGAKTAVRRGRYVTRDPRRIAGACRSELVDILLDQGVRVSRSATLTELADLAQSHLLLDADRFAHLAARARFAPPADARTAAREARQELRSLRRELRRRLSAHRRVRGLLSVRSLGFNT